MRKPKTTQANKQAFLKAYQANLCMVTKTCKQIGISRTQYYFWIQDDPDFSAAIDMAEAGQIEFVEDALLKRIKEGSDSSIQFYLKTKGKKAGYGTQVDITSNGETLTIPSVIQLVEIKKENNDENKGTV